MAPRKKKVTRRRGPKMVSILGAAEGYFQANLITSNYLGTNPISFILGDAGPTFAVSGGGISLVEIVRNPDLLNTIGSRLMNPEKAVTVALQSAVGAAAFRAGRRLLRRPINTMNRAIKPLALGVRL
jgi:hypothetical protein